MRILEIGPEGYEIQDIDERDEDLRAREPNVKPADPLFPPPEILRSPMAEAAPRLTVQVVNRTIAEVVPRCLVKVGNTSAAADQRGVARIDLEGVADGSQPLEVIAPDVSEAEVGPGFPADLSKDRIWRPFRGRVEIRNGTVAGFSPREWISGHVRNLEVKIQPVWMKPRPAMSRRAGLPTMIVIHHTAGQLEGDVRHFLYSGEATIHYLIAPNGETYKIVRDDHVAWHSGASIWSGKEDVNNVSIGIEMTHKTGAEYPAAQIDATIALLDRLKTAYPSIRPERVVAHSDVAIPKRENRPPIKHGRKSTDPGSAFPWEQVERIGLGFQITGNDPPDSMYGGFFRAVPNGALARGDNDGRHIYGGAVKPNISGAVRELQDDLEAIGYYASPDGDFGDITAMALQMFQQHIFSGSRRRGPDPWNSGDGRLDLATARFVKRVVANMAQGASV